MICRYQASNNPAGGVIPGRYVHWLGPKQEHPRQRDEVARQEPRQEQATPALDPISPPSLLNPPKEPPRATPATLHAVYSALLAGLSIDDIGMSHLTDKRQLSPEQIEAMGVKSAPGSWRGMFAVCDRLKYQFGEGTLLTVPGFYLKKGQLAANDFYKNALVIPSFDGEYITGLRVQPLPSPENGPKYYWLSSSGHGGPAAKPRASIWSPLEQASASGEVIITEGEYKAFITAQYTRKTVISVPGVSSWASAGVVELAVKVAGKKGKVLLCYDSENNSDVLRQRTCLADALALAGLTVDIVTWPHAFKGIDDFLQGMAKEPALEFQIRETRHVVSALPVDLEVNRRWLAERLPEQEPTPLAPTARQELARECQRRAGEILTRAGLTLDKRATLIKSPKGTGKTEALIALLMSLPATARVLLIGHRIALLGEIARRLRLELYLDMKERDLLIKARRLAICADSLPKLASSGELPYFDLIVIDESEQVLAHLDGETVKNNRVAVWTTFEALLKSANKVVMLDADLSAISYQTIARLIGPQNVRVIKNNYVAENAAPVIRYPSRKSIHTDLMNILASVEQERQNPTPGATPARPYIGTNSQKEALALETMIKAAFPHLRGLCITQHNSATPEVRAFLQNLNQNVPALDYLIASPTLGTGVDISIEHFTETFLIGVRRSTNHKDLLQQAARNRRAAMIHVWIDPAIGHAIESPEIIETNIRANYDATGLLIGFDDQLNKILSESEERFLALHVALEVAKNISQNNLAELTYTQFEAEGHEVMDRSAPALAEEKRVKGKFSEAKKENKEKERAAILAAPEIDSSEVPALERKVENGAASVGEIASLQAYKLRDYYGTAASASGEGLAEVLDFDGGHGQGMGKIKNLLMLTGEVDPKAEDRKEHAVYKYASDYHNYTTATTMRRAILTRAGLMIDGQLDNGHVCLTSASLTKSGFVDWVRDAKTVKKITATLGITVKSNFAAQPIDLVSATLAQCGLTLLTRQWRESIPGDPTADPVRVRHYWIKSERLTLVARLAMSRLDKIAENEANNDYKADTQAVKGVTPLLYKDTYNKRGVTPNWETTSKGALLKTRQRRAASGQGV